MLISRITALSTAKNNFKAGIFKEVGRTSEEHRCMDTTVETIKTIYFPGKNETQKEIDAAVRAHNYTQANGDVMQNATVDPHGKTKPHCVWSTMYCYNCTKIGERLPFDLKEPKIIETHTYTE